MIALFANLFTRDKAAKAQDDLARIVAETYRSPACESYRTHRRAALKGRA